MNNSDYLKIYDSLEVIKNFNAATQLCIDPSTDRLYTVKRCDISMLNVFEPLTGRILPNIPPVRHVSEKNGYIEVMSDYVSGTPLCDVLTQYGSIPEKQAVSYALDICTALESLHGMNIIHRDVNPNNVVITYDGHAVLIDYGIAREFKDGRPKDTVILGTPGYAAPEQFGFAQSDAKTDIYALGVLLNVMITGAGPDIKVTEGYYGRVVERCISIDAAKRYGSASALKKALKKHGADFKEKAEHFFSLVPGVRTKNPFLIFVSIVGHAFLIHYFATVMKNNFQTVGPGEQDNSLFGMIGYSLFQLFLYASFYTFAFNPANVWQYLPLKNSKPWVRRFVFTLIALTFLSLLFRSVNG